MTDAKTTNGDDLVRFARNVSFVIVALLAIGLTIQLLTVFGVRLVWLDSKGLATAAALGDSFGLLNALLSAAALLYVSLTILMQIREMREQREAGEEEREHRERLISLQVELAEIQEKIAALHTFALLNDANNTPFPPTAVEQAFVHLSTYEFASRYATRNVTIDDLYRFTDHHVRRNLYELRDAMIAAKSFEVLDMSQVRLRSAVMQAASWAATIATSERSTEPESEWLRLGLRDVYPYAATLDRYLREFQTPKPTGDMYDPRHEAFNQFRDHVLHRIREVQDGLDKLSERWRENFKEQQSQRGADES